MTISLDERPVQTRRRLWLSALALVLFYAVLLASVWPSVPGPLGNVDATTKVWQVESILRGQLHLTYRAATLDPTYEFIPTTSVVVIDGKPYAMYLNLFTALLAAGSFIFGRMTYQIMPLLFTLLTIVLMTGFVRRHRLVSERSLWQVVLVLGFCTPLFYYTLAPMEHGLATLLTVGAFILTADGLVAARAGNRPRLLVQFALAGLCLGLTPLVRPECYALALAVGVVAIVVLLVMKIPLLWCLVSGAVMAAGGALVLAATFGILPLIFRIQSALNTQNVTYFRMPMHGRFWQFLFKVTPGLAMGRLLTSAVADPLALTGSCLLVAAVVMSLISGVRRSWRRHLATGLLLGALSVIIICWGLDGVFASVPLLTLLFFLRGDPAFREPVVMLVLGSAITFMLLLGLLLPNPGGVRMLSPRYLLPVVVPAAVVAFCLVRTHLNQAPSRWLHVMLVIVVIVSVVGLGKGLASVWHSAAISRNADRRLGALPEPLVRCADALHRDGVLYHAPKTCLGRTVLSADDEERFLKVVAAFRRNGIRRFTVVGFTVLLERDRAMIARAGGTVVDKQEFSYQSTALVVELAP